MMKKKGTNLTQLFDQKVNKLISSLLLEKSQELVNESQNKEANGNIDDIQDAVMDSEKDPFENAALARDLTSIEVLRYVITKDATMARTKRKLIEESIARVLPLIKSEEAEELNLDIEVNEKEKENILSDTDLVSSETQSAATDALVSGTMVEDSVSVTGKEKIKPINNKKRANTSSSNNGKRSNKRLKDRLPPKASLSQLGGMTDIIAQLMELIGMPILHPEIYSATGVEPPRGVLLHGPPGCGKTSLANALAGDLKVPFISVSAPSIVSGMSGESEKKVRELFQEARSLAPCLMFIDEIDAITPKREGAQREMEKRIVAQLLTCIDELSMEKNSGKPVIIIGATNRPDSIDPALRRAGRFDREICLNVPDENSRIHILKAMTQNLKIDGDLDFKLLAKRTPGFVGADLKALASAAGICAIKRIFSHLSEMATILIVEGKKNEEKQILKDSDQDHIMEIDDCEKQRTVQQEPVALLPENFDGEFNNLSTIEKFLKLYPSSLTQDQLAPLSINFSDFLTALPTIQPTAKREGFATIPDVSWSNVGALLQIRVELHMAVVQPIKRPELYDKFGINVPGGVLLWGPPGCGKTLLAKAVANESRANFISIKGPELLNKYVGESERAVRQVFTRARASVPCIIFFDELDALVPKRDTTLSESSSRVVNTLLTELDGLNDRKGIFVIGATNRPDMIDPAMLRPGRLDKTLYVELPNVGEKFEILQTIVKSNKIPVDSSVDLKKVANDERILYFSGADLAALVREAGVFALKKKFYSNIDNLDEKVGDFKDDDSENVVTMEDFENALRKVKASVSDEELKKYHGISRRMDGVIEPGE